MPIAFTADIIIVQLIIAIHLMATLSIIAGFIIALDKENSLKTNLAFNGSCMILAISLIYAVQLLINKVTTAGIHYEGFIVSNIMLSTHLEFAMLISNTGLACLLLLTNRKYLLIKGGRYMRGTLKLLIQPLRRTTLKAPPLMLKSTGKINQA